MKDAITEAGTKIRGFIKTLTRAMADTSTWKDESGSGKLGATYTVERVLNGAEIVLMFYQNTATLYVDGTNVRLREPEWRKLGKEVCKLRRRLHRVPEQVAIAKLEAMRSKPDTEEGTGHDQTIP